MVDGQLAEVGWPGLVGLRVDDLLVVLPVEELSIGEDAALVGEATVLRRPLGLVEVVGEAGRGRQRRQVEAAHHRVGAVEFHIVRVVLQALHQAVLVRVPVLPGELERLDARWPDASEPSVIAADQPFAVHLDNRPHLPIGRRVEARAALRPQRQRHAEADEAVVLHRVGPVCLAYGPLQGREEVGESLGVVPDMGTGALATPAAVTAALEAVEGAVGETQAGVGAQDRQLAADRVESDRG